MGVMNYLRNKAGLIVGAIGLAIVAFIVSDVIRSGTPFWSEARNRVGEVAGVGISYEEFNAKVEESAEQFKEQMGQNTIDPSMMSYVVQTAWDEYVSNLILKKEYEKLGVAVGEEELFDMIQGKNPDPQILRYFTDPKTGVFDRAKLVSFLKNLDKDPSGKTKQQWLMLENNLVERQFAKKYGALVSQGLYATTLEAQDEFDLRQKVANIRYVGLDYASVSDAQIKVSDADYEDFYEQHKGRFKINEEHREIDYVIFNAAPTSTDSLAIRQQMLNLLAEFRKTNNDSLFVALHAETKRPLTYHKKGAADVNVDSLLFNSPKGTIIGPMVSRGAYKIAKLVDAKMSPDSVKASHILIDPNAVGGMENAKRRADSVRRMLNQGMAFVDLAARYSADPGSKDKGGQLGTFARGQMVSSFEDACFDGKIGDIKIVNSPYGIHVVKIENQIGYSKVAKIAIVDKEIVPSKETQNTAYSNATAFLSRLSDEADFTAKAKELKLRVMTTDKLESSQSFVMGIENARELVRWAYNAEIGDFTPDVLEMQNVYVVAKLKNIEEKGYRPFALVKREIEYEVKNLAKAKFLTSKIQAALSGATVLEQVAQKLNKVTMPAMNLVAANPVIPELGREDALVGTVFASSSGKLSKPVMGEKGVYVFVVDQFLPSLENFDAKKVKDEIAQQRVYSSSNIAIEALKQLSNIKDNRIKFY